MARASVAVALLILALLAALSVRPRAPATVHLSGDGAGDVRPLLGAPLAADPSGAALEVVLLRRWQNLEALPALRRLCRGACDGRAAAVLIRRPGLRGRRQTLLVDVGRLGAGPPLDRAEAMPGAAAACVAALIDAGAPGPGCPGAGLRTVWRPLG
jgi:hypothetical protein